MLIGISGKIGSGKDTVGKYLQYLYSKEYPQHTFEEFQKYPRWIDNNDWQIKKYADKLKEIVCLLIGCTREQLEDINFKNKELGEEWIKYELSYVSYSRLGGYEREFYTGYYSSKQEAEDFFKGDLEIDYNTLSIKPVVLTPRLILQLLGTECGRQIIHPNCWVNALFADYRIQCDFDKNLPINDNWIITDVRFPNEADAIKERGGKLIRLTRTTNVPEEIANHPSETALDNYDKFDVIINNLGSEEDLYKTLKELAPQLISS